MNCVFQQKTTASILLLAVCVCLHTIYCVLYIIQSQYIDWIFQWNYYFFRINHYLCFISPDINFSFFIPPKIITFTTFTTVNIPLFHNTFFYKLSLFAFNYFLKFSILHNTYCRFHFNTNYNLFTTLKFPNNFIFIHIFILHSFHKLIKPPD